MNTDNGVKIDTMKCVNLFLIKAIFFILPLIGMSQSECNSVSKIIYDLNKNFDKGIYIYSARKVKIQPTPEGPPKYIIKGKNKSIGKLIEITNIECIESAYGSYIISKEVLDEWNTWLIKNCRKRE